MVGLSLRGVCLDYPLYGAYDFSIKRRLLGRLVRESGSTQTIRAIDDVSIEATAGTRIGLAGPNGSGKSTLLRLIAGVYPVTSGRIDISGKVMPLLGLNAGVNLDFVAADNISLLLRISGRKPTKAIVDEIWAFTELEERMRQLPLRMFSSGMLMRVLFATATAFPADILLLDEWLSVVDGNFSAKAEKRLLKLVLDRGRIVKTVSLDAHSAYPLDLREKRA
jgi:lipopolysaccharide transport system ATP-binding protein